METQKFRDSKDPRLVHVISQGARGWEHRVYVSAKECDKQNVEILRSWGKLTFWELLRYKLTGKVR